MSDGQRTITITLTNAQYDVLTTATTLIAENWQQHGDQRRKRDKQTLTRAMQRITTAWTHGTRQ